MFYRRPLYSPLSCKLLKLVKCKLQTLRIKKVYEFCLSVFNIVHL